MRTDEDAIKDLKVLPLYFSLDKKMTLTRKSILGVTEPDVMHVAENEKFLPVKFLSVC